MQIPQRLKALRQALETLGLDAVVVPSNDPHQSEYVADHWKSREWISGFTGSAGVAVVTKDAAGLWTDSRYYLQAEQELAGTGVTFFKAPQSGSSPELDWLKEQLKPGSRVCFPGALLSGESHGSVKAALEAGGLVLVTDADPVAMAWSDRPALPMDEVFAHPVDLAGMTCSEKLEAVRKDLQGLGAEHLLLVSLDDIAWTFNLRGRDVDYNPVFYAYAWISSGQAMLFIQPGKVPDSVATDLRTAGVELRDYGHLPAFLGSVKGKVSIDPLTVSYELLQSLGSEAVQVRGASPTVLMKAKKNPIELAKLRHAMEKDGVALLRLCMWLESNLGRGPSEHEVGQQLAAFRAEQPGYFGESFPAIAGYAGNGAIVHYRPAAEGSSILKPEGVFLLDSGGQYTDGTTDITRTFALGPVPAEAVQAYTLVLKGHIALGRAVFPVGTVGHQLDTLARMHLWSHGLNYGHGTGHGVGFFLNVHEGPQGIGPAANGRSRTPLQPGMITSNEPGYYAAGQFGIRIENLVLCVEGPETGSGKFLRFESLSLFPISDDLIDWGLITAEEREWLREYHQMVLDRISPLLNAGELAWLQRKCQPYLG